MMQWTQQSQTNVFHRRASPSKPMGPIHRVHVSGLLLLSFSLMACGSPTSDNQQQAHLLPSKMTASKLTVTARAGLVSIEAQNAPLDEVLTELWRQVPITFTIPEEMKAERLTLSIQSRPLEETLRQLFIGKAYAFRYRKELEQDVIAGVDLFSRQPPPTSQAKADAQSSVKEGNSGAGPSSTELARTLKASSEPAQRMAALGALTEKETEEDVTSIMAEALSDSSPEVRESALEAAKSSLNPVPIVPLASMATQDADPAFRMEAMSLMMDQFSGDDLPKEDWDRAMGALNHALADPDPDVRVQAAMFLSDVGPAE